MRNLENVSRMSTKARNSNFTVHNINVQVPPSPLNPSCGSPRIAFKLCLKCVCAGILPEQKFFNQAPFPNAPPSNQKGQVKRVKRGAR